jgi:NlpC/P60 family putative phage cell wall peptidase
MDASERRQREAVVAEARSWLGTPYHHAARLKGVGCDCLTLIAEVFARTRLVPPVELPHYPPDWYLHHGVERYVEGVLRHAAEVPGPPRPGDLVLWRFGRAFSHGGIAVAWPLVVHAYVGHRVRLEDASKAAWLTHVGEGGAERGRERPRRYFSPWPREA